MRKLLLCLAVAGTSLAVSEAPKQADAQMILPACSSYCCTSPNATPTTLCRLNPTTAKTCDWFWSHYFCP